MQVIHQTDTERRNIKTIQCAGKELGLPNMSIGASLPDEAINLGWRYWKPLSDSEKRLAKAIGLSDDGTTIAEVVTTAYTEEQKAAIDTARAAQEAADRAAAELAGKEADVQFWIGSTAVKIATALVNKRTDKPLTAEEIEAAVRGVLNA